MPLAGKGSSSLPRGFSLAPYATVGLGGYTPDYGAGFSIGYRIPLRGAAPGVAQ